MIAFVVEGKPLGQNAAYRRRTGQGRGLMKTEEAKDYWMRVVGAAAAARGCYPTFVGPVEVHLWFYFANEQPDIDGPLKGILDAMQVPARKRPGASVYRNDRQVRRLVIERDVDRERPRVEVTVDAIDLLAGRHPEDFRAVLRPDALERLNRRELRPSVRRFAP